MNDNKLFLIRHWAFIIFFVCPGYLLTADLVLLGSGLWSELLGFSVRKVLLFSICTYSAFSWFIWESRSNVDAVASLTLTLFLLLWAFLIPIVSAIPLAHSLRDAQLFVGLIFLPFIYSVLERKNCWVSFKVYVFWLTVCLASLHLLIAMLDKLAPEMTPQVISIIKSILEPLQDEADTSVFIGPIEGGFRVFWGSSIYLLLGFYLTLQRFRTGYFFKSFVFFVLILFGINATLTRAMMVSIPLFFFSAWLIRRFCVVTSHALVSYLIFGALLLSMTLPIVLLSDPSTLAFLGLGRGVSDDLRHEQISPLVRSILDQPLFGRGFGAFVDVIRSEAAPWSYEMSILALYMKVGLAGALALLAIFGLFAMTRSNVVFQGRVAVDISRVAALLIVIIFCGNTNPYIFSMLGFGLLSFAYFEYRSISISTGKSRSPMGPSQSFRT